MKIRILNGGHASLCYPAAFLGVKYVHQALEHPVIGPFLAALEENEIIPTVPPVPDTDLKEYWKIIQCRFSNPTLCDTITRICYDGASRQPKFIIPVATETVKAGRSVDGLATVSAMWCRYCQGTTEAGDKIESNDPIWDKLQKRANDAKEDPKAWLAMDDIYGELSSDSTFVDSFCKAMKKIEDEGVEATLKSYIDSKEGTSSSS
jgi:mannitol 2-dehydrogenase